MASLFNILQKSGENDIINDLRTLFTTAPDEQSTALTDTQADTYSNARAKVLVRAMNKFLTSSGKTIDLVAWRPVFNVLNEVLDHYSSLLTLVQANIVDFFSSFIQACFNRQNPTSTNQNAQNLYNCCAVIDTILTTIDEKVNSDKSIALLMGNAFGVSLLEMINFNGTVNIDEDVTAAPPPVFRRTRKMAAELLNHLLTTNESCISDLVDREAAMEQLDFLGTSLTASGDIRFQFTLLQTMKIFSRFDRGLDPHFLNSLPGEAAGHWDTLRNFKGSFFEFENGIGRVMLNEINATKEDPVLRISSVPILDVYLCSKTHSAEAPTDKYDAKWLDFGDHSVTWTCWRQPEIDEELVGGKRSFTVAPEDAFYSELAYDHMERAHMSLKTRAIMLGPSDDAASAVDIAEELARHLNPALHIDLGFRVDEARMALDDARRILIAKLDIVKAKRGLPSPGAVTTSPAAEKAVSKSRAFAASPPSEVQPQFPPAKPAPMTAAAKKKAAAEEKKVAAAALAAATATITANGGRGKAAPTSTEKKRAAGRKGKEPEVEEQPEVDIVSEYEEPAGRGKGRARQAATPAPPAPAAAPKTAGRSGRAKSRAQTALDEEAERVLDHLRQEPASMPMEEEEEEEPVRQVSGKKGQQPQRRAPAPPPQEEEWGGMDYELAPPPPPAPQRYKTPGVPVPSVSSYAAIPAIGSVAYRAPVESAGLLSTGPYGRARSPAAPVSRAPSEHLPDIFGAARQLFHEEPEQEEAIPEPTTSGRKRRATAISTEQPETYAPAPTARPSKRVDTAGEFGKATGGIIDEFKQMAQDFKEGQRKKLEMIEKQSEDKIDKLIEKWRKDCEDHRSKIAATVHSEFQEFNQSLNRIHAEAANLYREFGERMNAIERKKDQVYEDMQHRLREAHDEGRFEAEDEKKWTATGCSISEVFKDLQTEIQRQKQAQEVLPDEITRVLSTVLSERF